MPQNDKRYQKFAGFMWVLCASFIFYKYAVEVSPSVMTDELMASFNIQGAALGNLAACYFYAYLIMQLPTGILLDRYGVRILTTIAFILCALGTLVMSMTSNLWIAQIARFVSGLGAAFAAVSTLKLTAMWFRAEYFALLAGLMMTIGMFGAVFGQAPLATLIDAQGWRNALYIIAIAGLGLSIVFYAVVRDRKSSLSPYHLPLRYSLKRILGHPQNWWLSLYSGLAFAPISLIGGIWGVPFLMTTFHYSRTNSAADISLVFIGFAIGAPLFGFVSDWYKKRKPFVYLGTLVGLLISCLFIYVKLSPFMLSCAFFLFGFFMSAFLLVFSMIREINPIVFAGTSIGFMNLFNALLCAISDPLVGWILDIVWDGKLQHQVPQFTRSNYELGLSLIPIFLVIACILMCFVKETHCQQNEEIYD